MRHPKVMQEEHRVAYALPTFYDSDDVALIDEIQHEVHAHEQQEEAEVDK